MCYINRILYIHIKEGNLPIYDNMGGTYKHHTKWSKSDRKRSNTQYDLTYIWNLNQNNATQTHSYRLQTNGCQGKGWQLVERGHNVQTSSCKRNYSWRCNV